MPILTWSQEYSVNVAEIDEQHEKLCKHVSRLHAGVEARIDKNDLRRLLIELVGFTRYHFAYEEELMDAHGHGSSKTHRREHRLLLKHMDDLVQAVSKGKYPTFFSDYDVSNDWFLAHILNFDKKLGKFLNSKGVF